MITEETVKEALSKVMDPEINIDIVNLGFIYNIDINGADVTVDMTLTTRGCPMHNTLGQSVVSALNNIDGIGKASVKMVWDPPWNPKMMSDAAKQKLGFSDDMMAD